MFWNKDPKEEPATAAVQQDVPASAPAEAAAAQAKAKSDDEDYEAMFGVKASELLGVYKPKPKKVATETSVDGSTKTEKDPLEVPTMPEGPKNMRVYFPEEMSCWEAFNEVVACYSVGGQVRNLYRFGSLNYCDKPKDKWKFCMGVKLDPEEIKKAKIKQFYMKQLAEKMTGGSSEDIWERR